MKKIFGFLFMLFGLFLIGIGSYDGFETFSKELTREDKKSYFDGLYYASGDSVFVAQENDKVIKVSINNEAYEFVYNGEFYEDENSGFYLKIDNEELTLYKDGEVIRTLHKTEK